MGQLGERRGMTVRGGGGHQGDVTTMVKGDEQREAGFLVVYKFLNKIKDRGSKIHCFKLII